ncbi:MAG: tetratricopeptide repeat protein, partial [Chitinophagaceae bacterium]|nr:tetratricopeptide repeat protein [Chitinophagaceae bacterium]
SAVVQFSKNKILTDEDKLLIGISYLQLNNLSSAISVLAPITVRENNFKQDAEYYLALAYLKNEDYDKALDLMQAIKSNPQHVYHQKFSDKFIRKVRMLKWK